MKGKPITASCSTLPPKALLNAAFIFSETSPACFRPVFDERSGLWLTKPESQHSYRWLKMVCTGAGDPEHQRLLFSTAGFEMDYSLFLHRFASYSKSRLERLNPSGTIPPRTSETKDQFSVACAETTSVDDCHVENSSCCFKCAADNTSSAKFCLKCGSPMR